MHLPHIKSHAIHAKGKAIQTEIRKENWQKVGKIK
jgi:hypothetical protein